MCAAYSALEYGSPQTRQLRRNQAGTLRQRQDAPGESPSPPTQPPFSSEGESSLIVELIILFRFRSLQPPSGLSAPPLLIQEQGN